LIALLAFVVLLGEIDFFATAESAIYKISQTRQKNT
jgi:hypothetical protein